MPKIPYMYNRRHHKSRRNRAATSIARAWRNRKRAKIGLVQRTVTANRRALSMLRKKPEVKEKGDQLAIANVQPDTWNGQVWRFQADNKGETTGGTPAIVNPLYLEKGDGDNERIGSRITLTSLSYHVQIDCEEGALAATSNRVGMLVVLDRQPLSTLGAGGARILYNYTGTAQSTSGALLDAFGATNTSPWLMFKNKATCEGPDPRFKILKHHKGIVQPQAAGSVRFNSVVFSGSIKGNYNFNYDVVGDPLNPTDNTLPMNQRLLFYFYSDSVVFPAPQVNGFARLRYRDT